MHRYDKDKDNYLRYSEFCDAFLPIDSFHASLLAKKTPATAAHLSHVPRVQVFYPETRRIFLETWKLLYISELEVEKMRVGCSRKHNFSSHDAFM
jgi:hypothetical protein